MKHKHYDMIVRAAGNTDAEVWHIVGLEWRRLRQGIALWRSCSWSEEKIYAVILPEEKEIWQALLDGKRVTATNLYGDVADVTRDNFMSMRMVISIPVEKFTIHDEPEQEVTKRNHKLTNGDNMSDSVKAWHDDQDKADDWFDRIQVRRMEDLLRVRNELKEILDKTPLISHERIVLASSLNDIDSVLQRPTTVPEQCFPSKALLGFPR